MLNQSGKLPSEMHFVFYNNLKSPDGAIQHTGDNRTGQGDDDDEVILANLPLIDANISEILVIASIHEAHANRHNFGLLQKAYIRLLDIESKREILRYDLDQDFGNSTDMEFGRLKYQNNEWHFFASGIASSNGLQGYVDKYI
jgi:tellurium resistance protein TerD